MRTRNILYLHKCPRCTGPVEVGSEPQYRYARCLYCGWRIDMPVKRKVTV